ncbi:intraflagellar transport protein 20 homolog isoform X1 [Aquarana catesbeiana]|uniref:intraflagellar transport protein 20 homolog isoform X1 n=2 Tax=Ranidae TaxID=8397 RepID=UPI003CC9E8A3
MSVNISRLSPWQPGLEKWERRSEAVTTDLSRHFLCADASCNKDLSLPLYLLVQGDWSCIRPSCNLLQAACAQTIYGTVIMSPLLLQAMAKDSLSEAGLHFDELNKLRILDPDVSQQTTELKEECREFVDKIGDFQKIVGGLIDMVDQLAKETENEKMKAIGARNLLKSISKQREAQQQQLHALIAEKKMQLERYQIEYEALCKVEAEQNEFIDQFILQK